MKKPEVLRRGHKCWVRGQQHEAVGRATIPNRRQAGQESVTWGVMLSLLAQHICSLQQPCGTVKHCPHLTTEETKAQNLARGPHWEGAGLGPEPMAQASSDVNCHRRMTPSPFKDKCGGRTHPTSIQELFITMQGSHLSPSPR
jgi:hypothetical protein